MAGHVITHFDERFKRLVKEFMGTVYHIEYVFGQVYNLACGLLFVLFNTYVYSGYFLKKKKEKEFCTQAP